MSRISKLNSFSDEEFCQIVAESKSANDLKNKLGYGPVTGGAFPAIYERIYSLNLDTSHWVGQGWSKGKYDYSRYCNGGKIGTGARAINPIIALRGHKCECCGLSEWNNKPIPLQLHHKDGDHYNNELDNLELLCPNCHAQTDSYCGKNKIRQKIPDEILIDTLKDSSSVYEAIRKLHLSNGKNWYERLQELASIHNIVFQPKENDEIKKNTKENDKIKKNDEVEEHCQECGCVITKYSKSKLCQTCCKKLQRKVERPSREELKELIRNTPFVKIAEQFGVSDKAICKWCIGENLPSKRKEINSYSDEEWENI